MPCFATAVWLDLKNHLLSTDQFAPSDTYLNGVKRFTEWVKYFKGAWGVFEIILVMY